MTAYALDGLLQAREHKVDLEDWRINSAVRALRELYAKYPRAIPDLKAYEIYVLSRPSVRQIQSSDAEPFDRKAAIDELWSARSRMAATGRALLLMTLDSEKDARAETLAGELVSAAETRGDVSWWTVTTDPLLNDWADTSVEASALTLKALALRRPGLQTGRDTDHVDRLMERVARWLVLNRTAGGYWVSTKQTALALEGLLAFMQARNEKPAPVTAEVYVNNAKVATQAFDAKSLLAPNPVLIEAPATTGANTVRIVRRGAGALYYDAAVRYYDKPAASERTGSRKLAIVRRYSTLSPVEVKGRIVYRETAFSGTAKAGDLILVRLTTAGSNDWRYLMLEDPIPAGTEPVEKDEGYELEQRRRWYWGSQRELRDDRVVFFLDSFDGGRAEFSYLLKVTTPGTFNAMPARISPMYVPDVSASSEVITLTVPAEGIR
jgi:uncharacterized protein YfaS (alpha-2-macroglobulin family)